MKISLILTFLFFSSIANSQVSMTISEKHLKQPALKESSCKSSTEKGELFAFAVRQQNTMWSPIQMGSLSCQDALKMCESNHRLNSKEFYRCHWNGYKIYERKALSR